MARIPRWREWRGLAGINALIDFINQNTTSVGTLESSKVTGAAISTDKAIARFAGTTGKVVQNSTPIVQDDGRISTVTDPSSAQDAATKAYVDAIAVNLGKRARVRAATTANITISTALNNGDTLDGVTLATGDLVLVKNQSTTNQNGVYVVGSSPARFSEFDTYDEHPGSLIAVEEGTANADTLWLCTSNVGGTLNTTAIAFTQLSVSAGITQLTGDVTAGPGSGSQAATIANSAVTLAKIANAAANSKLVGSGASGSGSAYSEITLGTNLAMSGTTLNATGGGSGNAIGSTTVASPPGSPASGDLDLYSDGVYASRYSGSAWVPWGPIFPFTDPALSAPTTWVNQGGASVDSTNGGIYLLSPASSPDNVRIRAKTAPSTPYTITAAFIPVMMSVNFPTCGIGWRDSASGKLVIFNWSYNSSTITGRTATVTKLTNPTTFSAEYLAVLYQPVQPVLWFQISDNGTNRICRVSPDGQHWIQIHSIGRTDFMTPDQVCFAVNSNNANYAAGMNLLSWKET